MKKFCDIALLLAVVMVIAIPLLPCMAGENKEEDKTIFADEPQRGRRPSGGFELTDAEKNLLLEAVKKNDPKKAREIEGLRKKDPKKFVEELKNYAREEYVSIVGGRVDKWLESREKERQAAFEEWLKENVPQVSDELKNLKITNPDEYIRKYDWADKKYGRVFYESRRHPEEAKILLEDLKLQERRDFLVVRIKRTADKKEKEAFIAQLENVLSDRYDLILIRRQMAYERLLRRLEELQNNIRKSREEIDIYKKEEEKNKNIEDRKKTLLEGKKGILQ